MDRKYEPEQYNRWISDEQFMLDVEEYYIMKSGLRFEVRRLEKLLDEVLCENIALRRDLRRYEERDGIL